MALNDNLIGAWHFDEESGLYAYDWSGNNNTGTRSGDTGGPVQVIDAENYCLEYDATKHDRVDIANEPNFDHEWNQPFSFTIFFNTSSETHQMIASKMIGGAPYTGWEIWKPSTGTIRVDIWNNYGAGNILSVYTTQTGFHDGVFHFAGVTYDGSHLASGVHIQVDDQDEPLTVLNDALGENTILNNVGVAIGARDQSGSLTFDGRLDESRYYIDRELSGADLLEIRDLGRMGHLGSDVPTNFFNRVEHSESVL